MREGAVIVGIGETKVGKHPGRNALDLQCEAVRRALADARIDKSRVDAVYALGSYIQPMQLHGLSVIEYLGLAPRLAEIVDVGGTVAFITMIQNAMGGDRRRQAGDRGLRLWRQRRDPSRARHARICRPDDHRRGRVRGDLRVLHRRLVRASRAALSRPLRGGAGGGVRAESPLTARRHATLNENAALPEADYASRDYRASPWIAEPFRRLDCSPVVDGAGAFVIVSRRVARELDATPVSYLGAGSQATHKIVSLTPDIPELGMAEAGRRAFAEAGLTPQDVDLLTVHDGFTASISVTVEALGFCGAGECGRFASEGGLGFDGALPVNPHGGLLSQGHVGRHAACAGGGAPAARRRRATPGEERPRSRRSRATATSSRSAARCCWGRGLA